MTAIEDSNESKGKSNSSQKNGLILGGVLLVVIAGFVGWSLFKDEPPAAPQAPAVSQPTPAVIAPPEPEVQPEPVPESLDTPEPVTTETREPEPVIAKVVLPSLEHSDTSVFKALTDMSWHHDFTALFINKDIIRRFVVLVDNMAAGTMAREFSTFKGPVSRFKVNESDTGAFIDESSFERYDVYLAIIASAEPAQMIQLYHKYKPLVKQVYDEIGYPDHDFTDTLLQAIDHILETPVIESPIELVSPKVMYDYKNKQWQSLTSVQKQVLRLGGKNVKKLKPLLRRYRSLLAQQ